MIVFANLSTDALRSAIDQYRIGLAQHAAGSVNYPCGVSPSTVRCWLSRAQVELDGRSA